MGREVILMKKISFDINNLFAKKEVVISKKEIIEIVYFAIQNGIVTVESENICGVNEENSIKLLHDGVLKIDIENEQHTILLKPFDYIEDCGLCGACEQCA